MVKLEFVPLLERKSNFKTVEILILNHCFSFLSKMWRSLCLGKDIKHANHYRFSYRKIPSQLLILRMCEISPFWRPLFISWGLNFRAWKSTSFPGLFLLGGQKPWERGCLEITFQTPLEIVYCSGSTFFSRLRTKASCSVAQLGNWGETWRKQSRWLQTLTVDIIQRRALTFCQLDRPVCKICSYSTLNVLYTECINGYPSIILLSLC